MIYLDVKGIIDSEQMKVMCQFWGGPEEIFTVETLNSTLEAFPDEKQLMLNIDCEGGSCAEGFKIYDALRLSGKEIFANIEGSCHSMAMTILCAAPVENRSANPNIRALIHRVRIPPGIEYMTADDLLTMAEMCNQEEEAILDVYAERTGKPRDELFSLMKEEKIHTAQSLLELGFISKINSYTTNQFFNFLNMGKNKMGFFERLEAYKTKNQNSAVTVPTPVNFDYQNGEGEVVFSTTSETDDLTVGSTVTISDGSSSGSFELSDGRKVTIEDNVVTDIELEESESLEERVAELEELLNDATNRISKITAENSALTQKLTALENSSKGSKYKPKATARTSTRPLPTGPTGDGFENASVGDIKELAKKDRETFRVGKSIYKQK